MNASGYTLVVDRDPVLVTTLAAHLDAGAVRFRTVCNGREALDAIRAELPALLLLESTMPLLGRAGLFPVLWLLALPIPTVLLSGPDEDVSEIARAFPCVAALTKPLAITEVLSIVAQHTTQEDCTGLGHMSIC
jgi:CheY-like chemotaxis protein